ncbi:MAG TPA: cytochrome P450 [Microthrixaceae bacterium]|nr:cytochrome P450 [Microthrixaceae bacterium]
MSDNQEFQLRSGSTWRDPFTMYEGLRENDPVHRVAEDERLGEGSQYWVLSRFDDVWRAAGDARTFSSADGLTVVPGERERIGLTDAAAPMVMQDPPAHTAFRRLVAKGFTPRRVAVIEPQVRSFVRERLSRLDGAGPVDVIAELFKPLPSMVVAHYLGVPEEDRSRFDVWTEAIVEANASGNVANAADRLGELLTYFSELIEIRRNDPGDDVISDLVQVDADGEPKSSLLQTLGFAFTMVAGGNDTTTGLLGVSAELLTEHPDQRQRLIDDPALIGSAVDELLRLSSPVQGLARTVTADVTIHGTTIPKGDKVLLLYGSANRDPREFGPTAPEFRVDREIDRILTFSVGPHHCLGAAAARLQGRVVLEELLARYPEFSVDPSAGVFADGNYVRRYRSLPFVTG